MPYFRKVPRLLTHLKEREREQGKERACSRPSKDNERCVCFVKKKRRKIGLNLLPLTNYTLTRCSYYVLRCMGGSNLTRTKGKRGKNPPCPRMIVIPCIGFSLQTKSRVNRLSERLTSHQLFNGWAKLEITGQISKVNKYFSQQVMVNESDV